MAQYKIGIVIVDEQSNFAHRNLSAAKESLKAMGCTEQNILLRHAPRVYNVTLVTQFFAEYTEVDCVYIALPEGLEEVRERLTELELQCRMPIGTSLRGMSDISDMIRMVRIQSEMVAKADMEMRGGGNFRLN